MVTFCDPWLIKGLCMSRPESKSQPPMANIYLRCMSNEEHFIMTLSLTFLPRTSGLQFVEHVSLCLCTYQSLHPVTNVTNYGFKSYSIVAIVNLNCKYKHSFSSKRYSYCNVLHSLLT